MHTGENETLKRWIRIGAIALTILAALAVGHQHARAQIGVDLLRQAVDAVKDKGKVTDLLKGRKKRRGGEAEHKGRPDLRDRFGGRQKDHAGRGRRDDRGQDRLSRDGANQRQPGDRFSKDGSGRGMGKDFRDRTQRDKADNGFGRNKGKDPSLAKGKGTAKDRLAKDKSGRDKSGRDHSATDKGGRQKAAARDKADQGKGGRDTPQGRQKAGRENTALGKSGNGRREVLSSRKAKAIPDRRATQRFAKAKSPVERSKLRLNHRQNVAQAKLRLPPRPFPGTPKFTGVPPAGETRFVSSEMVLHVAPNVPRATVEAAWKRHGMVIVGERRSALTGGTLYICRVPAGVSVATAVRAMEGERVGIASPQYVYRFAQEPAADTSAPGSPEQYVPEKFQLAEIHKSVTGKGVLVAVIDSKVDAAHPDLAHSIVEQHNAVGLTEQPHTHGTGMIGAIVSHQKLRGIAPDARILAVHAFATSTRQSPEATTRQIIEGIEWAIAKGARIINMSFAGPYDPLLQLAMKNAHDKGVILIAASGNQGAKSPPLYPAADPHVIAVTATDESDELFPQAVRGPHVDVSAPGVDVIVPAPADAYQLTTGTSVAAAHVSGVVALLLERHPEADAQMVLEVLTATARNLNPKGRDDLYGWGLIDPAAALQELDSRIADGKALASAQSAQPKRAAARPPDRKAPKTAKAPGVATPRTAGPSRATPGTTAPRPAAVGSIP